MAALLLAAACGKSPTAVFEKIEEAAKAGDADRFASFFTEESAPFARALLSVYRTQSPRAVEGGTGSKPLDVLSISTVVKERVEDKLAYVTVKTGQSVNDLVFVADAKGEWKLDVQRTEKLNAGKDM